MLLAGLYAPRTKREIVNIVLADLCVYIYYRYVVVGLLTVGYDLMTVTSDRAD